MLAKWECITEAEILDANINKYNDDNIVNFYADYEEPHFLYYEYDVIFQAVLTILKKRLGRPLCVVDVCGGAGKASFVVKKCDPLCEVSLVDVSRKMLDLASLRAKQQGLEDLRIVHADAFSFFEGAGEYDLIIFSSAIHHFKDPLKLLCTAAGKLSAEGIIITIADPTPLIRSKRYKFFAFLIANSAVKKEMLKQLFLKTDKNQELEKYDVAEYQTLKGIDDKSLSKQLRALDLIPLLHIRYPAGEPYMTKIMPMIGLNWAFSMVLRGGSQANNKEIGRELKKAIASGLPFKYSLM